MQELFREEAVSWYSVCAGHSIIERIPPDCFFPKKLLHSLEMCLGHCPVVGGNWLQLSAVHRVYGMALQNGVIAFFLQDPFYPVQISHFTPTKAPPDHHIASTMLDSWRQALLQHLYIFSASHECSSL